ncbi:MAG: hypothetical protein EOP09_11165 [Proteobacteria bacterium]|nr:MAG: hypothetical protein EOP09_11165 [Pseudomonadota bacterium]
MKRNIIFLVLGLAVVFSPVVYTAVRPNFKIDWSRTVPSTLPEATLAQALDDPKIWPIYYHSLKSVRFETQEGKPTETIAVGNRIYYSVEPKGKEWKRFELIGEVSKYEPGKHLSVKLVGDTKKKLTTVFEEYEWSLTVSEANLDLKSKGFKSMAVGTAEAITATWRGRVFGSLFSRILMNQVYYVDLVKLGTLDLQKEAAQNNLEPKFQ